MICGSRNIWPWLPSSAAACVRCRACREDYFPSSAAIQINIKVINQSSDELSIVVGVDNRDFEKAIRCIYDKFISGEKKKL